MLDLVLVGGRVLDGSGRPWFRADVGLVGSRIVAIGRLRHEAARRRLDVADAFVTPGFIDMHAHSEAHLLLEKPLDAKVLQGVTLEVLGQDGVGLAPVTEESVDAMARHFSSWSGLAETLDWHWRSVTDLLIRLDHRDVNVVYLTPHGNLRAATVGWDRRETSDEELDGMRRMLADCLARGAIGLSTGLNYLPCMFASTGELTSLCEELARAGGYFAPHHRGYGVGALAHYQECLAIGSQTGAPIHLTHASLLYEENRGKAAELLQLVDTARRDGVDVSLDTYPYTAAAGTLAIFLPGWLLEGGPHATRERLDHPNFVDRLRKELATRVESTGRPMEWSAVMLSGLRGQRLLPWEGLTLQQVAERTKRAPFDGLMEILREEGIGVPCLELAGDEENVRTIMRHPAHMVGSDGGFEGNRPHPRAWGSFVRYLAHYCRDEHVLTWEQTIRKMTALPARRLGLTDRGLVRPGMVADVNVFDPEALRETATYANPCATAEGFSFVFVNGEPVVAEGRMTGNLPGRALTRGPGGGSMPIADHGASSARKSIRSW